MSSVCLFLVSTRLCFYSNRNRTCRAHTSWRCLDRWERSTKSYRAVTRASGYSCFHKQVGRLHQCFMMWHSSAQSDGKKTTVPCCIRTKEEGRASFWRLITITLRSKVSIWSKISRQGHLLNRSSRPCWLARGCNECFNEITECNGPFLLPLQHLYQHVCGVARISAWQGTWNVLALCVPWAAVQHQSCSRNLKLQPPQFASAKKKAFSKLCSGVLQPNAHSHNCPARCSLELGTGYLLRN